MTVVAPVVANSLARANVPSAKAGNSNTPIGPFHTTSLARSSASPNCAMLLGPMYSTRPPAPRRRSELPARDGVARQHQPIAGLRHDRLGRRHRAGFHEAVLHVVAF